MERIYVDESPRRIKWLPAEEAGWRINKGVLQVRRQSHRIVRVIQATLSFQERSGYLLLCAMCKEPLEEAVEMGAVVEKGCMVGAGGSM